ncbi:cupin domain-containing protein [Puniceicoccus vermicola]|uniref:Cupin domain-containing protein n=1 Tax=Puniceicoccus vermicola TaxID=388746 RepID=A0A7X1AUU0_9BACT|nr:cupin domain-containing protein [Puniceicoccus vermicola]MBC2600430.1 cupin domain-containing protein [Puniceicoccus vermicola]
MSDSASWVPESFLFEESEGIPNHPEYPVLLYRNTGIENADEWEKRFGSNGWGGCWRWGVFDYHHFHSNAHEALGVISGQAKLALGGPGGKVVEVKAGDLVILPAGTGHKNLDSSTDFFVVGAYPSGQEDYDLHRGDSEDLERMREAIRETPKPEEDPLLGGEGPLLELWP